MKVIMAKDSAFIPTLKDGDFPLRPSQFYELKKEIAPGSTKDRETAGKPPIEDRMKILENYVGIVKLKKPFTLEEILELEEDNWLY